MKTAEARIRTHRVLRLELWGVRAAALLTLLIGSINFTSAIQPALQSRLAIIESIFPLEVRHGSRITSALAGFALIILAESLWRRKRTAWVLSILLLIVSIISHMIKGLDYEEASITLALLILLIGLRQSFHATSDRPSLRQGLAVLSVAFLFTLLYGVAGFYLLDKHYSIRFGILDALRQTVIMFTSFYDPRLEPVTGYSRFFADSIYVIGFSTLSFALAMIIRPVLVRLPSTPEARKRAENIIQRYGRTSLVGAALFEDKSYFFGSEDTVIVYAAQGRGAMVLGDPIGPSGQAAATIAAFVDFCAHNDWTPAFVSTLPDYLDIYKAQGFDAVCIGYEAIVPLDKFSLEGSENKDVRYAVNRLKRLGYAAEVYSPPLEKPLINKLREISDAWLTMRHGGEMHFSDGWFDDNYIRGCTVIVVHGPDEYPTAFANLLPEFQKNELTIDLMRHIKSAENGTMEFMFAQMLLWAKESGYATFSLGLSALVGVGEKPDDPRVEQALHTITDYISRFYNFKGLHKFKEKFHPIWEPRYLIYRGPANLPLTLTTLLQVHSGHNYLWKFLKE